MQSDPASAHDELVEKVARALAKAGYAFAGIELTDPYSADADYWNNQTRAALAVARPAIREECAKVALGEDASATEYYRGRVHAAAAIRAME
jgi:hypothetical protein